MPPAPSFFIQPSAADDAAIDQVTNQVGGGGAPAFQAKAEKAGCLHFAAPHVGVGPAHEGHDHQRGEEIDTAGIFHSPGRVGSLEAGTQGTKYRDQADRAAVIRKEPEERCFPAGREDLGTVRRGIVHSG